MNQNGFALITGTSGGLGRSLPAELAGRHHNLILVAHPIEPHGAFASELRQSKPITVLVSESDLCRPGAGNDRPHSLPAVMSPAKTRQFVSAALTNLTNVVFRPVQRLREPPYSHWDKLG
jgi:NAD(P)-dependent dehydrogenase (short-subunit alcohol dehydrogenase family)